MILLQLISDGLLLGAVYALFSSGLTLIWGMMNVMNFAHGQFVMLAMYIAFFCFTLLKIGPTLFVPLAAIGLFGFGAFIYVVLIRHVMRGPMLAQIICTFGLALVLQYSALWAFSANFVSLPTSLVGGVYDVGGIRLSAARLIAGATAIVLTAGLHLLLTRTDIGSRMLAVSEDPVAAALVGIRPDPMQALAWGLGAAATGVAGGLIALFFYVSPDVGNSFTLIAFVTVCLGGFGSVPGALLAGLIIGVIESFSAYWLGPATKDVVVYGLFVALLWVRPQGMFGRA